ncbi:phosphatase PAP2 family protein [Natrinema versiforme]|uniref:phosphatase PAP2 family protein n=1 Tax=Natrinema versiforme TaxID=88724 RepID=UPI0015868419
MGRGREPWPVVAVLAAIGLTTVLKSAIGLTRPPGAAIGGYGFPSGHALGATVAYGLAADRLEIGSRRARVAVATIVVGTVAASRVVIGVHYPIDVVAGLLLGLGVLVAVRRLWSADSSPTEATDIEVRQSILEAEGDQTEGGDSR